MAPLLISTFLAFYLHYLLIYLLHCSTHTEWELVCDSSRLTNELGTETSSSIWLLLSKDAISSIVLGFFQ